jgi:hypothetical protein
VLSPVGSLAGGGKDGAALDLRRWDDIHFADVATYKCWTRAVGLYKLNAAVDPSHLRAPGFNP